MHDNVAFVKSGTAMATPAAAWAPGLPLYVYQDNTCIVIVYIITIIKLFSGSEVARKP